MSLIPVNLLQTATSKFFMSTTYMMSRKKLESSVLGLKRTNKPIGCYFVPNREMQIFHEHNVHDV